MTVTIQQFTVTALMISLLFSCGVDSDVGYFETANRKNVLAEDLTSSNNFDSDVEFAKLVAENSLLEMQLAALTINRSQSDTIKRLAISLMTDHNILNTDLQQFAERRGVTLPSTLSMKSQMTYEGLAGKAAGEFDKAYRDFLVRERENVLTRFRVQAEMGNDPELKDWAARKIAVLDQHLAAAKALHVTKTE